MPPKMPPKLTFFVQIINIYHCDQLLVIDNSVIITSIITITISIVITVVIIINGTIKKQEGLAGCNKRAPGDVVVYFGACSTSATATIFASHSICPFSYSPRPPLSLSIYKVPLQNYVMQKGNHNYVMQKGNLYILSAIFRPQIFLVHHQAACPLQLPQFPRFEKMPLID